MVACRHCGRLGSRPRGRVREDGDGWLFGASSLIHTAKILRLSEDLPILIECVDRAGKIEAVLRKLDAVIGEGLVTIERAELRLYRGRET